MTAKTWESVRARAVAEGRLNEEHVQELKNDMLAQLQGQKLAELRRAAGYNQRELGGKLESMPIFFVDQACPICEQGILQFKFSNEIIYLMCDECDSVFLDARSIIVESVIFPSYEKDWKLGDTNASACRYHSRWASLEEIRKADWDSLIKNKMEE